MNSAQALFLHARNVQHLDIVPDILSWVFSGNIVVRLDIGASSFGEEYSFIKKWQA
jgi:hypothetical protein